MVELNMMHYQVKAGRPNQSCCWNIPDPQIRQRQEKFLAQAMSSGLDVITLNETIDQDQKCTSLKEILQNTNGWEGCQSGYRAFNCHTILWKNEKFERVKPDNIIKDKTTEQRCDYTASISDRIATTVKLQPEDKSMTMNFVAYQNPQSMFNELFLHMDQILMNNKARITKEKEIAYVSLF